MQHPHKTNKRGEHLVPRRFTAEQMAAGRSALALRNAVTKRYPVRAGYLRSAEVQRLRPRPWLRAEWDKLISKFLRTNHWEG